MQDQGYFNVFKVKWKLELLLSLKIARALPHRLLFVNKEKYLKPKQTSQRKYGLFVD